MSSVADKRDKVIWTEMGNNRCNGLRKNRFDKCRERMC